MEIEDRLILVFSLERGVLVAVVYGLRRDRNIVGVRRVVHCDLLT